MASPTLDRRQMYVVMNSGIKRLREEEDKVHAVMAQSRWKAKITALQSTIDDLQATITSVKDENENAHIDIAPVHQERDYAFEKSKDHFNKLQSALLSFDLAASTSTTLLALASCIQEHLVSVVREGQAQVNKQLGLLQSFSV